MRKVVYLALFWATALSASPLTEADYREVYPKAVALSQSLARRSLKNTPSLFIGNGEEVARKFPSIKEAHPILYFSREHAIVINKDLMQTLINRFMKGFPSGSERKLLQVALVHELVHALQNEISDIPRKLESASLHEALLWLVLVEGHAVYFEYRAAEALRIRDYRKVRSPQLGRDFAQRDVYARGFQFIRALAKINPELVWRVLTDPPTDSMYLSHPELYAAGNRSFPTPDTELAKQLDTVLRVLGEDIEVTRQGVYDLGMRKALFPESDSISKRVRNVGAIYFHPAQHKPLNVAMAVEFDASDAAVEYTTALLDRPGLPTFVHYSLPPDPTPCPQLLRQVGHAYVMVLQLGRYVINIAPASATFGVWPTEAFDTLRRRGSEVFDIDPPH